MVLENFALEKFIVRKNALKKVSYNPSIHSSATIFPFLSVNYKFSIEKMLSRVSYNPSIHSSTTIFLFLSVNYKFSITQSGMYLVTKLKEKGNIRMFLLRRLNVQPLDCVMCPLY